MTEAGGDRSTADVRQELLAQHRRIMDVTLRVGNARDLPELLRCLGEFRALIVPHFNLEEAPDGFFDTVGTRAPRHRGRLEQLKNEHRAFLEEIDRLLERARANLGGPATDLLKQGGELARRLHQHEARENELLADAMYSDLGEGD